MVRGDPEEMHPLGENGGCGIWDPWSLGPGGGGDVTEETGSAQNSALDSPFAFTLSSTPATSPSIWIPNLANDPPPTALTPTISPRKDSSARSSALWLCLTVYPPQDLQQLLLCPLGVQLGQGMAGHLLSYPTASSSLASHLQPCPLLSTPHWPLERYSSTYSNLVQALTPSDTPHCPQDKFWIFIYNV